MFNNPFLKKDPLLEAVKNAQMDGEYRRQAEAIVNEEFGVYSRKAVIREQLAAYDAALEEAYTALKEGKKLADKDYDKDGKIESPKDEVWGSRLRAAKLAGKMEEEQIDELKKPDAKTAMKVIDRAQEHDDWEDSDYTRSNRLYNWKYKHLPGKRARNQKDTGKAELPDYSPKDLGYGRTIKKSGQLTKATQKDTKAEIKSRLGKHTQPKQLPEEAQSDSIFGAKMSNKGHPNVYHDDAATSYKATADRMRGGEKPYNAHAADLNKIYEKKMWEGNLDPNDPSVQGSGDVTVGGKPASVREERWIQAALKKKTKGALHKDLGVSTKKKIPLSKLKAASDDPGKTGKRARLALTLRKLHEKLESDSFKAAQGTGKSVIEAVDAVPSWVNQPAPGIQKAARPGVQRLQGAKFYRGMSSSTSGQGTAKFLPQTSVKATGPAPKTGTSLVPSGNRLPATTGGNKLPVPRSTGAVTTQAPKASGSGFTYSRGPSTPGVNPPHPSEKIGGFGNFKPASGGAGVGAAVKGVMGATARGLGRLAGGPIGTLLGMTTPAGEGENEFARQAKYGATKASSTPAAKPADTTPKATTPKAAAPVKQSFKQAFQSARQAASAAKQDPNKAQFTWNKGTYQAAATKKDYVPASKQFKTNVGAPASSEPHAGEAQPAAQSPGTASAPLPPARPKNLTPTSAPATTVAKTSPAANSEKIATQIAGGKLASPESVATSVKSMKPASASSETMTPEKMAPDTTNTAAPPKSSDLGFGSKEALTKDKT